MKLSDLIARAKDSQSEPLTYEKFMEVMQSIPESNAQEIYVPAWFVEAAAENNMTPQELLDYLVVSPALEEATNQLNDRETE